MKRWIIPGLLLLSLIVFVVCKNTQHKKFIHEAIPVLTEQVEYKAVSQSIRSSGMLASAAEMKLSFKIGGIVKRIYVREGQRVRQGQILAELKQDEILAGVKQARVGLEKAERDFERAENLYNDRVATLEQKQNAESALEVAQSQLEIAEFNFKHARILAPADGQILKKIVETDELIGAGHPVLLFGSQDGAWRLRIGVADQDMVRLAIGDSAQLAFDAYPGQRFEGRVSEIAGAPDMMNGLFEIEVSLSKKENIRFFSGLVGVAEIYPSKKEKAFIIPFSALVNVSGNRGYVYRVDADTQAVKLPVEIVFFRGKDAIISTGLEGVNEIITEGAAYLNGNTKVRVGEKNKLN